ncbi:DUF192 domain-containing protein [Psychroserpens burtonensis]|uniref:DUF192 domain-containing protein n=1 Tax=Psychroserpens burtonensis TaxID=49278 RepID=A0A5C7B514_9FLAO|nr:DUF192 domain-containing protein [Psychroserpens burtonensis]TXE16136.1 DUF192 domain-containing protein [Psychroserpens burtonensis]
MKRFAFKVFVFSFFGSVALQLSSCKEEQKSSEVKQVEVTFKKEGELQLKKAITDSLITSLDIEIADDEYSTQTGLMYRSSMANNQGMLFIFPDTNDRSFYMKNTQIPLDIIFVSEDKTIVSIQKNAEPMNETSLPSEAPAKYVLEVNAGLSGEWGLNKGDIIEFTAIN